jgi:regulator of replication initiation timing
MSQKTDPFLDDFVSKVHSGEYLIHEDAQKVNLPGGTLAYLLGQNITQYEEAKKKKKQQQQQQQQQENDLVYDSVSTMTLNQLVNLAFTHNVVRNGEALYKKIKTLETQVSTLTSERWELQEQVKRMFSECPKCHYKLGLSSLPTSSTAKGRKRKNLK